MLTTLLDKPAKAARASGLSKQDGQTHRLPTEAEWEYALPQR